MTSSFDRVDVSGWPFVRRETIGQTPTEWLAQPDGSKSTDNHWLFKPVEVHSNGTRQGGDWAEKLASEIARVLGLPAAEVELASRNGIDGSISCNVIPELREMWTGGLWLDANPDVAYLSSTATKSQRVGGASRGYTLENIRTALDGVGPPQGTAVGTENTGFETFAGYLMFDALIANRDRHEDNWGVITEPIGAQEPRLSAAFDHAGSLGYQLTDEGRSRILAEHDGVKRWVDRGTAWRFFSDSGPAIGLVELARQAAAMDGEPSELHWLSKMDSLSPAVIDDVLGRMSEMSEVARTFVREVLLTNAERIRNGYRNSPA
jgi:hypothetical protein